MTEARTRYTFFIDPDTREALAAIKERDGIPESEQIRRAIRSWVEAKGIAPEPRRTSNRTPTSRKGTRR